MVIYISDSVPRRNKFRLDSSVFGRLKCFVEEARKEEVFGGVLHVLCELRHLFSL